MVPRRSKLIVHCFFMSCMYYSTMDETLIKFSYLILSYLSYRISVFPHLFTVPHRAGTRSHLLVLPTLTHLQARLRACWARPLVAGLRTLVVTAGQGPAAGLTARPVTHTATLRLRRLFLTETTVLHHLGTRRARS